MGKIYAGDLVAGGAREFELFALVHGLAFRHSRGSPHLEVVRSTSYTERNLRAQIGSVNDAWGLRYELAIFPNGNTALSDGKARKGKGVHCDAGHRIYWNVGLQSELSSTTSSDLDVQTFDNVVARIVKDRVRRRNRASSFSQAEFFNNCNGVIGVAGGVNLEVSTCSGWSSERREKDFINNAGGASESSVLIFGYCLAKALDLGPVR